ncbi:MAG TPA: ABC transporter substrate-binding protein [Dehalococcoidia bacterium]|jgi:ABC-type transport system substrate-binding protein
MTRRRALVGASSVTASAAALSVVGCGSGGGSGSKASSSSQPADASGLLYSPKDTTSSAKAGGTLKSFRPADIASLDPLSAASILVYYATMYSYPRLFKFTPAKYPDIPGNDVEGDFVQSYEISPDKLLITAKLRQGLKWDSRTPTNGREIDSQDVVFSWNKFAQVSGGRADVVYTAQNPTAPIESMTAVDKYTVQIKVHQPNSSVIQQLGVPLFFVMPRESDGGFDPKGDIRGYGPWLLQQYRSSQSYTWQKNPDYYVKGRPFIDTIEETVIPEYAARLSQFRAGNIYTADVSQADILATKKDIPDLQMFAGYQFSRSGSLLTFGYEGDSPFKDERMRQAASMLVDREGATDVLSNRANFKAVGLDVPVRYNTIIPGGWEGAWLDPLNDKQIGPSSKFYKRDVAEAKKLVAAAGFPNGVDTNIYFPGPGGTPQPVDNTVSIYVDSMKDGGIRAKPVSVAYQTDFIPNYLYAYAKGGKGYNGMIAQGIIGQPTLPLALRLHHHPDGARFMGASADGKTDAHLGDPQMNDLIAKSLIEFDANKQTSMLQEAAKIASNKMYWATIPLVAVYTIGYNLSWPVIGNRGFYRASAGDGGTVIAEINQWIDSSKPPLGKS